MNQRVVIRRVDLKSVPIKECARLTNRGKSSGMKRALLHRTGVAWIVFHRAKLIAWSCVQTKRTHHYFSVYVDRSARRQGIGTRLARIAHRSFRPLRVNVWNDESGDFFNMLPESLRLTFVGARR